MAQRLLGKGMIIGYHTLVKQKIVRLTHLGKPNFIGTRRASIFSSGQPGLKPKKTVDDDVDKEVLPDTNHGVKLNICNHNIEDPGSSEAPITKLKNTKEESVLLDEGIDIKERDQRISKQELDQVKISRLVQQERKKDSSKVHEDITSPDEKTKVSPCSSEENEVDWGKCPAYYSSLSKSRLTGLVVMTAMAGYGMAPLPFDLVQFAAVSIGTGLTSCSANTFNQVFEVPYDSQMNRTKNRVLVRGHLTPLHATAFGLVSGALGVSILYGTVNGITAFLGFSNILLYAGCYTPLKRISIANTWVGAVVGALPPIMGWTACTNSFSMEALVLGSLLFAWQFPHFNALSWNLRGDYSKAGYRMMSACNPDLCKRTSLTYSLAMIPLCTLSPIVGLTSWTFAVDTIPVNGYLIYLAWKFYREGDSENSQRLFKYTLLHLPLVMMLMLISKKFPQKKDSDKS